MQRLSLPLGEIEYLDTGGSGPAVVFLHGLAMTPEVWGDVVQAMAPTCRCIVPLMPVGGHRLPIPADRPLGPHAVAMMIGDLIEALKLDAPTVVENDGGRAQTLAAERPDLVGRLVIASCEAFENYPPGLAGKLVMAAAQVPGGITAMVQALRWRPLRALPIAFGDMSVRPIPHALTDRWLGPLISRAEIRRDLRRYLRAARPGEMHAAAEGLRRFPRPALVVWGARDRMMPRRHGRQLAALLPQGRYLEIPDSGTLIPLDQPAALAAALQAFLRAA